MNQLLPSFRSTAKGFKLLLGLLIAARMMCAQAGMESKADTPYKLDVSVDEVSIVFHASDASGRPLVDLKPSELDLFDNEVGPGGIVALQKLGDRPLRVAFIVDTSSPVSTDLAKNRAIAMAAAQRLLRTEDDSGLVIGFRRSREIVQPWSHDLNAVMAGIQRISPGPPGSMDGTSVFDSPFSTCFYQFGKIDDRSENIVLLFSDGEDNASQTSLEQAVDACQHAHTAIYAIDGSPANGEKSTGPATLNKLAEQTGGRLIRGGVPEAEMNANLDGIESELREEYRLFYRPRNLKRDGSFHRIVLVGSARVASITAQSGYYAPTH